MPVLPSKLLFTHFPFSSLSLSLSGSCLYTHARIVMACEDQKKAPTMTKEILMSGQVSSSFLFCPSRALQSLLLYMACACECLSIASTAAAAAAFI